MTGSALELSTATPLGNHHLDVAIGPSIYPLVVPEIVSTCFEPTKILRIAWLAESAMKIILFTVSKPMPIGALNCALAPGPSI